MNSGLALTIVSVLSGALIAIIAWLTYRQSQRGEGRTKSDEHIKTLIKSECEPMLDKQREAAAQIANVLAQYAQLQQSMHDMGERQGRILDRLAVLETKIEVFWNSVAMNAAKIIHSPDPRRRHIDELLDRFMEGNLNNGDAHELKDILKKIRDWEPGKPSDFPIFQGEQTAAAILLSTMDHVTEGK